MKNPNGYGASASSPATAADPIGCVLQQAGSKKKVSTGKNTILWAIMPAAVLPLSPWLITINVPTT